MYQQARLTRWWCWWWNEWCGDEESIWLV